VVKKSNQTLRESPHERMMRHISIGYAIAWELSF
jgi:hypothetical protein